MCVTGYDNMGDLWAAPYDDGSAGWNARKFEDEMLSIWEDLRPLYNKLHAYVRMQLRKDPLYTDRIKAHGYLPANLMGNMWAQDWTSLDSTTKPFPNAPSLDATEAMNDNKYTALIMFEVANDFFQGLGLPEMTPIFWNKTMFERPVDKEVVCHASAEDFCLGKGSTDFR
jgi:peptidyl-dipeptidase A